MTSGGSGKSDLTGLAASRIEEAMARCAVLKRHLEDGVPLSRAAADADISTRTAERWLARYLDGGLVGLARSARSDSGLRKLSAEIVDLIEGMALQKPRPSTATLHRRIVTVARQQGWSPPSYSSIHSIVAALDPALVTLAHEGHAAYRNRFEMAYRHRAERPNAIWQADHTEFDILILDSNGAPVRPWLTTVIDDHSRAVAGYMVFLGAPSSLQTSLALRQAIWRKLDPQWPVSGIPDALYVDHGSDFISTHLDQVAADLHFQIVYSAVGRPQGRGKVERLFGTLNTELLPELPGHLIGGKPATPPKLSLSDLDAAVVAFIVGTYNTRVHSETGTTPIQAWVGNGWLPRMPDSLEDLDMLLVMVAKSRVIHRDGIHFQGLRYLAPTLAAYVGEPITIRYDPRDLAEIRVFHRNHFLCRAVSPEHEAETVTLKDIQTARTNHRRSLRSQINERITRVVDFLPGRAREVDRKPEVEHRKRHLKLHTYREDKS